MNWDDPAARAALVERVGVKAYGDAFLAHMKATTIKIINGYGIRPIGGPLVRGRRIQLYTVDGAARSFPTMAEAETFAAKLPRRGAKVEPPPPARKRSALKVEPPPVRKRAVLRR